MQETKKSLGVRLCEQGGWLHGVMLVLVKHCWTQCSVGRCTRKSPRMQWAKVLKESLKKFTEAKCSLSQQHQLVH